MVSLPLATQSKQHKSASPTVPAPAEGRRGIFQPTPLFDEMTFITLLTYFKE
jgi:hypothetical protein